MDRSCGQMAAQAIYLAIVGVGVLLLFAWLLRQDPPDGTGPFIDSDGTFLGGDH